MAEVAVAVALGCLILGGLTAMLSRASRERAGKASMAARIRERLQADPVPLNRFAVEIADAMGPFEWEAGQKVPKLEAYGRAMDLLLRLSLRFEVRERQNVGGPPLGAH